MARGLKELLEYNGNVEEDMALSFQVIPVLKNNYSKKFISFSSTIYSY